MTDEPRPLPPGVDVVALAGLVAQLAAPQLVHAIAEHLVDRLVVEVVAQLQPALDSIVASQRSIAAAQQLQRRPSPAPFQPGGYGAPN